MFKFLDQLWVIGYHQSYFSIEQGSGLLVSTTASFNEKQGYPIARYRGAT
jgi:hypothetical protein